MLGAAGRAGWCLTMRCRRRAGADSSATSHQCGYHQRTRELRAASPQLNAYPLGGARTL
jgi:hypothetical protein